MQEEAAALHQHAALLHARIDDLTAENDHLADRAAAGDAAVSRLQVRACYTSSHSATHHVAPSVLRDFKVHTHETSEADVCRCVRLRTSSWTT